MSSLHPDLRKRLREAVLGARRIAEQGAEQALRSLAVEASQPFAAMPAEGRTLRNALRARGRQLGDTLGGDGAQSIEHLVGECAYEHWHRMLFARFLAENHLLIHPEGVPVTLDEVRELAAAERPPVEMWSLAARWATSMLPAIFRPDDPVLAFDLAAEHRTKLEAILAGLPVEVFTADDGLGWVYQFWQEDRKAAVNKAEVKIGADELPAVTQLFTEPYMVKFLLHNTLGAWWIGRHGGKPPIEMEFLRTNEDGSPAAGVFAEWPSRAADLKCLDPCCGSGHFLVEMLKILVAFRVAEEKLNAGAAVRAVLRENLFGLEIDPRCTQIAAFAVALQAWKLAGSYQPLPSDGVHIACSGIAPRAPKEVWLRLADGDERLRNGLERLYETFRDAPTLGSLIDPSTGGAALLEATWSDLQPLLSQALSGENYDEVARELGVVARGIALAVEILSTSYTLVATNVPFLKREDHSPTLRSFVEGRFPEAKGDLATVFLARAGLFLDMGGTRALVLPQSWLFQRAYEKFRTSLLRLETWKSVVDLGPRAFRTINGEVVKVVLLTMDRSLPSESSVMRWIDLSVPSSADEKESLLHNGVGAGMALDVLQGAQLRKSGAIVGLSQDSEEPPLSASCMISEGIQTGDVDRYQFFIWEVAWPSEVWEPFQAAPERTQEFSGLETCVRWEGGRGPMCSSSQARIQGQVGWGQKGVVVAETGELRSALHVGFKHYKTTSVIVPNDKDLLPAVWAFCSSGEFFDSVKAVDRSLKVVPTSLGRPGFDVARWKRAAAELYPGGLPIPYSTDPTQWFFQGPVASSTAPMQVAVARLLGFNWPTQTDELLGDLTDQDGIACIHPLGGEPPAADRLRALLRRAYGDAWAEGVERGLLAAVGLEGGAFEDWLRDAFFEQHCRLFKNRPFIWHIWDGRRDGFHALVNYHRLDHKLLEKLTFSTLGSWIQELRLAEKRGEATAEARIAAALGLQKRLEAILEGEDPYDIFVRWKPLQEQPIGWNPDLNDGIRLNIRPFVTAGVLRKNPSVKWEKDRGKNPPGSPWGEERLNDLHLSLEEKRKARVAQRERQESKR